MATNPFKSFIAYEVKRLKDYGAIEELIGCADPTGGQWRTVHFAELPTGEVFADFENCKMGAVQFNERMLPGRVIKEELDKRVAHLADQQGHKVSKKDRAQMRDQVEFDLLPKAFIKRTVVHFAFVTVNRKPVMLVFTSSQKRADEVVAMLDNTFDGALQPRKIEMDGRLGGWLTTLASDGAAGIFWSNKSATLIGEDGEKVMIKDLSTDDVSIQAMLRDGSTVTSLGILGNSQQDAPDYTYTLTDMAIFKNFTIEGVKATQVNDDFPGFAVLHVTEIKGMLQSLMAEVGEQEDDL